MEKVPEAPKLTIIDYQYIKNFKEIINQPLLPKSFIFYISLHQDYIYRQAIIHYVES
jgi:hypothetical protein